MADKLILVLHFSNIFEVYVTGVFVLGIQGTSLLRRTLRASLGVSQQTRPLCRAIRTDLVISLQFSAVDVEQGIFCNAATDKPLPHGEISHVV